MEVDRGRVHQDTDLIGGASRLLGEVVDVIGVSFSSAQQAAPGPRAGISSSRTTRVVGGTEHVQMVEDEQGDTLQISSSV